MSTTRKVEEAYQPEGWSRVTDLYGPDMRFHDAEIVSFGLSDDGSFRMDLHCWRGTSEHDDQGYFVLTDHSVVSIMCEGVTDLRLRNISMNQHVIFSLIAEQAGKGGRIEWDSSVGIDGYVEAEVIRFSLVKGKPSR